MKKFGKTLALLAAGALLFGSVLSSCSSGSDDDDDDPKIKVTAADNATSVVVGKTLQLTADVDGVTWSSSDTAVATVDETGLVTGVDVAESVTITAAKDGYDKGTITLAVKAEGDDPDTPADGAMGFIWLAEEHMDGLEYVTDDEKKTTTKTYQDYITEEKAFGDVTVLATSTSTMRRTYNGETELTIDGETKSVKGYFQLGSDGTSAKKAMKFTVPSDATSVAIYAKKSSDSKTCKLVLSDGTTEVISQEASTDYTAVTYTPSLTADTVFYLYNDGDGGTNVKAIVVTTPPYTLQSIKVTTPPTKLEYAKNDTELSTDGMVVKATYSNGTKEVSKEVTGWTTSEFTAGKEGTQTITVSYTEGEGDSAVTQTDTFEITVKGVTQTGIEVTTKPTTTTYEQDSAIDLTGLEIAPVMSDGSKGTAVAYSSTSGITVEGFDSTTAGENITKTITVKYGEYTTTFEYTYTVTAVTYFSSFVASDLGSAEISAAQAFSDTKDNTWSISSAKLQVNQPWSTNDYEENSTGYTYTARIKLQKNATFTINTKADTILRIDGGTSSTSTRTLTITGADKTSWAATKVEGVDNMGSFYLKAADSTVTLKADGEFCIYGIHIAATEEEATVRKTVKTYSAPVVELSAYDVLKDAEVTATVTVKDASVATMYTDGTLVSTTETIDTSSIAWAGATVKDGKVDTSTAGTYTITASYKDGNGETKTSEAVKLKVTEGSFTASSATVSATELNLTSLTSAVSSDTGIATAEIDGTNVKITSVVGGGGKSATINVTGEDSHTASITVEVSATGEITATPVAYSATTTYTLDLSASISSLAAETMIGTNSIFYGLKGVKTESVQVSKVNSNVTDYTKPSYQISLTGGKASSSANAIKLTTTGSASFVMYVSCKSGKTAAISVLGSDGKAVTPTSIKQNGSAATSLANVSTAEVEKYEFTISTAGTYYIGGSGGGLYINGMSVTF